MSRIDQSIGERDTVEIDWSAGLFTFNPTCNESAKK
jgi:hypothetical protein